MDGFVGLFSLEAGGPVTPANCFGAHRLKKTVRAFFLRA
jgi:hypothetical protein